MTEMRRLRKDRELTLRELAHFAGCAHTTIARLERGEIDVGAPLKARIARALQVPVSRVFPPLEDGRRDAVSE